MQLTIHEKLSFQAAPIAKTGFGPDASILGALREFIGLQN